MSGRVTTLGLWLGGLALIAATLINVGAVVGRRIGLPLHGAIELVQVCVLIAGTLSLLRATALEAHARIHLVLDRIPAGARALAERFCALIAALFFSALLAGSLWIQSDLWNAHESSEVIGVPWLALRLIANLGLGFMTLLCLWQAVRRSA